MDLLFGRRVGVSDRCLLRQYRETYRGLPGVRKMWLYQGRIYMPVARSQLFAFTQAVNPSVFGRQWLVDRRDNGSIVYMTREIVSPYVQDVVDRVENAKATKALVEGQYERLLKLLATEQRLFDAELRSSGRRTLYLSLRNDGGLAIPDDEDSLDAGDLDFIISDEDRCRLEDALDPVGPLKHIPRKPVFGLTYTEDFYQRPQDINRKRMEAWWGWRCPNTLEGSQVYYY